MGFRSLLKTKDLVAPSIDQQVIFHTLWLCVTEGTKDSFSTSVQVQLFSLSELVDHGGFSV